jgi:hypothetical protein
MVRRPATTANCQSRQSRNKSFSRRRPLVFNSKHLNDSQYFSNFFVLASETRVVFDNNPRTHCNILSKHTSPPSRSRDKTTFCARAGPDYTPTLDFDKLPGNAGAQFRSTQLRYTMGPLSISAEEPLSYHGLVERDESPDPADGARPPTSTKAEKGVIVKSGV